MPSDLKSKLEIKERFSFFSSHFCSRDYESIRLTNCRCIIYYIVLKDIDPTETNSQIYHFLLLRCLSKAIKFRVEKDKKNKL